MNDLGRLIEDLRGRRGLSRSQLARRAGVTVQTILNLERDPDYNLGVRLLRQIEKALGVEFQITVTQEGRMHNRIRMGNDEFILYIRKRHDCRLTNDHLGRRIWVWLRDNAAGKKIVENLSSRWGSIGGFLGERMLPKTATQVEFNANELPRLYQFLDQLGQEQPTANWVEEESQLDDYRVGDYALVVDLLGTAARMADPVRWIETIGEVLDLLVDALNITTKIDAPEKSLPVFQHGDTIVVVSDDPAKLIPLGMIFLTTCWNRDVLAQAAIAGGGVFFITDPRGFGKRKPLHPNASVQVLVGPAVARAHHAIHGVKGPRLVLDEETVHVTPTAVWRRYLGATRLQVKEPTSIKVSEVVWWDSVQDDEVSARLRKVENEIAESEREGLGSPVQALWGRDIISLTRRLEHIQAFATILAEDAE